MKNEFSTSAALASAFTRFFSEAGSFVGTEKTLHALFYYHLLGCGFLPKSIGREFRLASGPVDVVLFDHQATTANQRLAESASVAIEFKGGAYNTRNALFDTIDAQGHCPDLDKMLPFLVRGVSCWFVAVDMAPLGVALSDGDRMRVFEQCQKRGMGFAYVCSNEPFFLFAPPRERLQKIVRNATLPSGREAGGLADDTSSVWADFSSQVAAVNGSEDDYCSLLYSTLRSAGTSASQVSLETYFGFAGTGKGMQLRPDLTLFQPGVAGRFNLYEGGDQRRSNDNHKLAHLAAIFEVKGSHSLFKKRDATLAEIYSEDIEKLGRWGDLIHRTAKSKGLTVADPARVFVAIDRRPRPLDEAIQAMLRARAKAVGVSLRYFHAA